MTGRRPAAEAWARALGDWAIPPAILDAAPEDPWQYPPALFRWTPGQPGQTGGSMASRVRAVEAIPEGGSVLDVGVGGGRASLPLVPPAALVVGVDSNRGLLTLFDETAAQEGIDHRSVLGAWPDIARQAGSHVGVHDVVVCHNVIYNVADLVPFARALTDHARIRVVLELTVEHPMANLNTAWRVLHGLDRPTRPMAGDAIAVLGEMGLHVTAEAGERQTPPGSPGPDRADLVAFARRRLCLGPERDAEIDGLLGADFRAASRRVVTVWWKGQGQ